MSVCQTIGTLGTRCYDEIRLRPFEIDGGDVRDICDSSGVANTLAHEYAGVDLVGTSCRIVFCFVGCTLCPT